MANGIDRIVNKEIKPYLQHGADLPYLFGDILNKTDSLQTLPFSQKDYFIDFVKGFSELAGKYNWTIPSMNTKLHLNPEYTGFVKFKPQNMEQNNNNIISRSAYILDGTIRYIQTEIITPHRIDKNSTFLKNNSSIHINSFKIYFENMQECKIKSISRNQKNVLDEGYLAVFRQNPEELVISIYAKGEENRKTFGNIKNRPLVKLKFDHMETPYALSAINNSKDSYATLEGLNQLFAGKEIEPCSVLTRHAKNGIMNFNRARQILELKSAKNQQNAHWNFSYAMSKIFSPKYL